MGYYQPTGTLDFEGTNSEKQMMENLLQVMDVMDRKESEWELPTICEDWAFPVPLLGTIDVNFRQTGKTQLKY